jgi:hypothetical protein
MPGDEATQHQPDIESVLERVRAHAFERLPHTHRQTTNLHIDRRVYEEGEQIGPPVQEVVAARPTILVWADEEPLANFAHPCSYLLYDAASGEPYRRVRAQFPPWTLKPPETLEPFHRPVSFQDTGHFRIRPIPPCPILIPKGERYAILFAGMSNKRHLNDIEFLYRTLIDRYGFNKSNIYALSFDGTLDTQDGVQTHWPGDGTPYRVKLTGEGTRAALEGALDELKPRLRKDDLLLIHTNNHGGYDGTPGTSNLCTYPSWEGYYAADFASKLGQLPRFAKLIVMMEQCHAGGFNQPIIEHSTAEATSVASAATEPNNSYVSADGNWDPFARDWIAAQAGHTPFGGPLAFNPDTDHDGRIEAEEAFVYADVVKDPLDTPNFSESSEAGGDIALGQEYVVWWWWCWILRELLEPRYAHLPIPEYHATLRQIGPQLAELAATLDQRSEELRSEIAPQLEAIVTSAFDR